MMKDEKIREYILPSRILASENCENTAYLLRYHTDQSYFGGEEGFVLHAGGWVLLDFGMEYSGGVKIVVNNCAGEKNAVLHVRFGESASEACAELGEKHATNDHALRDVTLAVAWVSSVEYGNTGYQFVRIANPWDKSISLRQIFGVYVHCGAKRRGSFCCSDERLNRIWEIGARTVYLNMQDYLYDGIKRDRVVWIGDMHPAASSVMRLFGAHPIVPKSLDFVRSCTPPDRWMNDIPAYTCWWLQLQRDWYLYTGDLAYLKEQVAYIRLLMPQLFAVINDDGTDNVAYKFIDWPSSSDSQAQTEGIRALLKLACESAADILKLAGDERDAQMIAVCEKKVRCLRAAAPVNSRNKQAAALSVFAGLCDAKEKNDALFAKQPTQGVSTFLGYYLLRARAEAGDVTGALDLIRAFWGAMADLGATTFWEDFDLDWAKNAKPIDTLLRTGEYDVHGDNGSYCYPGFRHSLCHGWASGPVPFLSEYVLGVRFLDAGCKRIKIAPQLGDLEWAEGCVPTPLGDVSLRCERDGNRIKTEYSAPDGICVETEA